jgi:proliferating cell nuclear antigen PCNA
MFTVVLSDPKPFRDAIDTIAALIDEGIFRVRSDRIELLAADRAMVAVVDFKIAKGAFERFDVDKEHDIGLNLQNLLTVLKRASAGDKLTMRLNETGSRLDLALEGLSKRNFGIPILELSAAEIPPVNQLSFTATAEVRSDVVAQGIDDADIVADSVSIELAPQQLKMWAEGDSTRAELLLEAGSGPLVSINAQQPVHARYPLEYLKKIARAARLADTAKIQLANDYPMKLEFIGQNMSLAIVLAPRVAED